MCLGVGRPASSAAASIAGLICCSIVFADAPQDRAVGALARDLQHLVAERGEHHLGGVVVGRVPSPTKLKNSPSWFDDPSEQWEQDVEVVEHVADRLAPLHLCSSSRPRAGATDRCRARTVQFDAAWAVSADAAIVRGCRGHVGTTAVPSVSDSVFVPTRPSVAWASTSAVWARVSQ
ncbi:MAG: hypothetical protein R2697_00755 [Ilumatobacteraceae bacterium]